MSNALSRLVLVAQAGQSQPGSAPAELSASSKGAATFLQGLVAVGLCLLAVWVVRRIVRPAKLSLGNSPGRPNALNGVHLAVVFALQLGVMLLLQPLLGGLDQTHASLVKATAFQLVGVGASLMVAARTFSGGLRRGLGLSARRWVLDSLRGVWAFLAVLPVTLAVLHLVQWLLSDYRDQIRAHEMLSMASQARGGWLVLLLVSTVVLAPLAEEVFFRGLVQSLVRRYTHRPWLAVLVASAIFAAMHRIPAPDGQQLTFMRMLATWYSAPSMMVLAIALGYNYERTGRLWAPVLIHALFNALNMGLRMAG